MCIRDSNECHEGDKVEVMETRPLSKDKRWRVAVSYTHLYKYTVNKKERRLAIKSLLSSKVLEKELTVVDKLELAEIKTKTMVKALADLKVEGKTLIVLPENNKNVLMSARNIEGVKTITLNNINVFDLLKYNNLVLPLETVKKIEEVYA